MNHPFVHLVGSRIREFFREPHALFWVYGFPLVLALGLGLAFKSSRPEAPIVDVEAGPEAERIAKILTSQNINASVQSESESKVRLKKTQTALIVHAHGEQFKYTFDPARSDSVLARYWVDAALLRGVHPEWAAAEESTFTEPGSRYIDFLLPGLMGMNIMGGGLFGVGFVLVDMRVRKLFKRLMATPMRHSQFLAALLVARLLFLVPEMGSLLLVGVWVFGIPIRGSIFLLFAVILLGSFAFSGLGLLLGCRTEKTETMSGMSNLVMLPSYIFSGIFFSSKRFQEAYQPFIQALPLTQLNDALREVMLDGAGLEDVLGHLVILALWGGITFTMALFWFRWR